MKPIELKELIREILLTEFQRNREIESKINEFGELNDEIDKVKNQLEGLKKKYSQLEDELRPVFWGLEFVRSEFFIENYRIDTMCFDNETNPFVIIEYTKREIVFR